MGDSGAAGFGFGAAAWGAGAIAGLGAGALSPGFKSTLRTKSAI
jgi:hypothetical protein